MYLVTFIFVTELGKIFAVFEALGYEVVLAGHFGEMAGLTIQSIP